MKITLNLLPESQRKALKQQKIFRYALQQEIYGVILIIVLLAGLFRLYLSMVLSIGVEEESLSQYKSVDGYEEIITSQALFKEVNVDVDLLSKIQNSHLMWSDLLLKISQETPESVRVENITTNNLDIVVKAVAKTRSDALTFKTKMSELVIDDQQCLNNIFIPSESLAVAEDTDFALTAQINKACVVVTTNRSGDDQNQEKTS